MQGEKETKRQRERQSERETERKKDRDREEERKTEREKDSERERERESSDKLGSMLQFCLLTAVIYLLVVFGFDSGLLCYKLLLVILLLFLWL